MGELPRQFIFDISIHFIGRALLIRDLVLGRVKRNWNVDSSEQCVSRSVIQSGRDTLDAVLVRPSGKTQAAVLICHGIGETVQHWFRVQQLLAAKGIASLVFDYSGYGRSSGRFSVVQSERDAESAFHSLQKLVGPIPISLLGFSLGSGIATAILSKVPANGLLLCAAFTSLRSAVCSVGVPRFLQGVVPNIWRAEDVLPTCKVPVLIVHGEKDRLFPPGMAAELKTLCGPRSEIKIVPNLSHNEPSYRPDMAYWGLIVSPLLSLAEGKTFQPNAPELLV